MFTYEGKEKRVVIVRFEPNDDILVELRRAVQERGIRHGAIIGGLGAVKSYGLHVVKTTAIPPGNVFFWEDNLPYDIVSVTGYVMDGRVHAHVSLSSRGGVIGGHLEEGMKVLNLAMVTVMELDGVDLTDMDRYAIPGGEALRRP